METFRVVVTAIIIVVAAWIVSIVLKIFSLVFEVGIQPVVQVSFANARTAAVVLFIALILSFVLYLFLVWVPRRLRWLRGY